MDTKTKDMFSETSGVLKLLGSDFCDKLPKDLIKLIEDNKNTDYLPEYSEEDKIDELDLKEDTKTMISFLYLSYWCESQEERKEIIEQIKKNSIEEEAKGVSTPVMPNSDFQIELNELFPKKEANTNIPDLDSSSNTIDLVSNSENIKNSAGNINSTGDLINKIDISNNTSLKNLDNYNSNNEISINNSNSIANNNSNNKISVNEKNSTNNSKETMALVTKESENIFKKIINKIKAYFSKWLD